MPRPSTAIAWALAVFLLASCGAPSESNGESPSPDPILLEVDEPDPQPPLPDAVLATQSELLEIAGAGSLRRLARRAGQESAFLSNLGGVDHFTHWDLMRRTGFDPNTELQALFEEPYATRLVGPEVWFIWPDLAAREPAELAPERLSYRDQARLRRLIGEDGFEAVTSGTPYPGVRTAISDAGAWRYYLHESTVVLETPDDQ